MEETLCASVDLNFGECNASGFSIEISDVEDISGLKIEVYVNISGYSEEVPIFTGYVDSAKIQPERSTRKIIAYDDIYVHGDDNVSEWYDNLFSETNKPEYKGDWNNTRKYLKGDTVKYNGAFYQYLCEADSRFSLVTETDDDGNEIVETYTASDYLTGKDPETIQDDANISQYVQKLEIYNPVNYGSITVKEFRDSLFNYVGIPQESVALINDSVRITKTLETTEIKFSDCIKAVCQINAVFGHISEKGIFKYISLGTETEDFSGNYKATDTTYEEFSTKKIDSVRLYGNTGTITNVHGSGQNCWNISNNFLLYSLQNEVLNEIAEKLFGAVNEITYTPTSLKALISVFPISLGSRIVFTTYTGEQVAFYSLKHVLSGGQITDQMLTADGNEARSSNTSIMDTLGLIESKTNAIVERVYEKFSADSAEIKIIYGDLANYKTVVAEKIQATEGEFETLSAKQANFETVTTEKISAQIAEINKVSGEFAAFKAGEFSDLKAKEAAFEEATVRDIQAIHASILELDVTELTARVATIEETYIGKAEVGMMLANYATIGQLNATNGQIEVLSGKFSSYQTQMAQELIAAKGWMAEGSIGDAQISNVSANKLGAGTIDTAIVTVAGTDGRLQISDNTIQIKDVNRVRVQIGKDESGDYSMSVWDIDGKLIWDALGATENTIQRKIIRDKMVADDAAIQALKIDFQSFDTALTEQGVSISGTVIQVGSKTLNVTLSEQNQAITEQGETLTDHAARITANENAVKLKVSTQDFDSYKTTVTSEISSAKTEAINTAASDASTKTDEALSDARSYTTTQITAVNERLSTTDQEISIMKGQIALKVEQVNIDTAINGVEIGGRNLVANSREVLVIRDNASKEWISERIPLFSNTDYGFERVQAGGKFTISFDYEITGITTACSVIICLKYTSDSYGALTRLPLTVGDNIGHFEYTFTPTEGMRQYGTGWLLSGFGADANAGAAIKLKKIKLEKGTKATDWTPAPEDIDSAISAVDDKFSSYSTITQTQAAIDLSKSSILSSVSETYSTKTEVSTVSEKVISLETWKTEASQKITKDGIIQTVGNYYAYESDLEAAENRITTAESRITQQADQIALRVEKAGVISAINQTAEVIKIDANKINLSGYVTVTNLATSGQTAINGDNITTGLISADRIDANGLFAKDITATGTIRGVRLEGAAGSFSGYITASGGSIGGFVISSNALQSTEDSEGQYSVIGNAYSKYVYLDSRGSGRLCDTFIQGGNVSWSFCDADIGDTTVLITPHVIYGGKMTAETGVKGYLDTFQLITATGEAKFEGVLYANGGVQLPNTGDSWVHGMTETKCLVGTPYTSSTGGTYHPILRQNTALGNVFNLGGITVSSTDDRFGIFIFKNGRTANGYDYSTYWNAVTGTLNHDAAIYAKGTITSGEEIQSIVSGSSEARVRVQNGLRNGTLVASATGKLGIYDNTNAKWLLYSESNGAAAVSPSEFVSRSANGFRIACSNYGFFIRNDDANTYFMFTNSGDPFGTWNNLRPIAINNATGDVSMGHVLTVGNYVSGQYVNANAGYFITGYGTIPYIYSENGNINFRYTYNGSTQYANIASIVTGLASKASSDHTHTRIISGTHDWLCSSSGNLVPRTNTTDTPHNVGNSNGYVANLYYQNQTKVSDRRRKIDQGDLTMEEANIILRGSRAKRFLYGATPEDGVQYGLYAQDFRDLLVSSGIGYVSALRINKQDEEDTPVRDIHYPEDLVRYGLDYQQFTPILIKGWQGHDRRLEACENRIFEISAKAEEREAGTLSEIARLKAEMEAYKWETEAKLSELAERLRELRASA